MTLFKVSCTYLALLITSLVDLAVGSRIRCCSVSVFVYYCAEQFDRYVKLRQQLLDTGDAQIVYVNDSDNFLGSGCDAEALSMAHTFSGKNWLGKSLMKLRNKLQV